MKFFSVLLCMFASFSVVLSQKATLDHAKVDERTLSAVQDHHNRRMEKLRSMIQERRQLVADHESGHRRLSGEEFDKATRQLRNFQRKLESMEQTNTREHHLERIEEMRSLHDENREDYLHVQQAMGKFNY
mmetsp:Transcript_16308/g.26535  ORF Transcript_16308/g.26535 Transcript_16308/m.26535 type:complete len:131 (-) Transcript_16308:105-497(-)